MQTLSLRPGFLHQACANVEIYNEKCMVYGTVRLFWCSQLTHEPIAGNVFESGDEMFITIQNLSSHN